MRRLSSVLTEPVRWLSLPLAAWAISTLQVSALASLLASVLVWLLWNRSLASLGHAWLVDGQLDLHRFRTRQNLPLKAVTTVEQLPSLLFPRVRLHLKARTELGWHVDLLFNPRIPWGPNRAIAELREQVWHAHRDQGASDAIATHRLQREGPRRGREGRQNLAVWARDLVRPAPRRWRPLPGDPEWRRPQRRASWQPEPRAS